LEFNDIFGDGDGEYVRRRQEDAEKKKQAKEAEEAAVAKTKELDSAVVVVTKSGQTRQVQVPTWSVLGFRMLLDPVTHDS